MQNIKLCRKACPDCAALVMKIKRKKLSSGILFPYVDVAMLSYY